MPERAYKLCSSCGKSKPLDLFYRDRRAKDQRCSRCKDCDSKRVRDPGKRRASNRGYYQANRERLLALENARHWANREKILPKQRARYAANREARIAKQVAWEKANPHVPRAKEARRRAQKASLPNEHVDVLKVFDRDGGICGICNGPVDPADWHLDHVVPLSKGGHHTYKNVQVSHPACNLRKGARLPT